MSLAEALGDQGRLVQAVSAAANALWQMGDNVRAHALAQRGLSPWRRPLETPAFRSNWSQTLGMILRTMGDYRGADRRAGKARGIAPGGPARARLGRALYPAVTTRVISTRCLAELGEFRRGERHRRGRAPHRRGRQQPGSLLTALPQRLLPALRPGQIPRRHPRLERSLALVRHASDVAACYHQSAGALGYAYALAGRLPRRSRCWSRRSSVPGMLTGVMRRACWAHLVAKRTGTRDDWRRRTSQPGGRSISPASAGERGDAGMGLAAPRRDPRACVSPRRPSRPKPTTARPSPWPRSWACARSRRTATGAWARCMPRPASGSRPVPRCRQRSRCIEAMEMTFWLPGDRGGTGAGGRVMTVGRALWPRCVTLRPILAQA